MNASSDLGWTIRRPMKPNQFLAHPDQSLIAHLIGLHNHSDLQHITSKCKTSPHDPDSFERRFRLLKPNSSLYHSDLNEPGLDVKCDVLREPATSVL